MGSAEFFVISDVVGFVAIMHLPFLALTPEQENLNLMYSKV
jgi:hypothetical protein